MLFQSDWHIHSEFSYDATLPLKTIAENAKQFGFHRIGITDHLNFNDAAFRSNLQDSAKHVKDAQKEYPFLVLGVELTPVAKPEYDYIAKNGTRDGFVAPVQTEPFEIELAATKEELMALGVRYAIGASHWRVDIPGGQMIAESGIDESIREWFRQQLWLACDERVTILGHPWYHGHGLWYDDISVIPRSMNDEIAAALKQNGKYIECNTSVLTSALRNEQGRYQYAELLREFYEKGIPITVGTDAHGVYNDPHPTAEKYLLAAGFRDGDFSEIAEEDLW